MEPWSSAPHPATQPAAAATPERPFLTPEEGAFYLGVNIQTTAATFGVANYRHCASPASEPYVCAAKI
jgi:hypothetical protein